MKKSLPLLLCIIFFSFSICFSQQVLSNKKEIISKRSTVFGSSNDFKELYLAITFRKVINSKDTTYNIKLQLYAPISEFREYIYLIKNNVISFITKSGKVIDLKLSDGISMVEEEIEIADPTYPNSVKNYSTILILNITKKKLIDIGSEPFSQIILPYYNSSLKVENKAIFTKPTLLIQRSFTQKGVKFILENNSMSM